VVESSLDLKTWSPLLNASIGGNEVRFDDTSAAGRAKSYRLRQP
jgi:hypothetical protein